MLVNDRLLLFLGKDGNSEFWSPCIKKQKTALAILKMISDSFTGDGDADDMHALQSLCGCAVPFQT